MKIIIVGCGRMGSVLASRLSRKENEVVVIDVNPAAFQLLPESFVGRTYAGNGLQQDILINSGIESADAFAAVTNSDVINAVVAWTAKEKFKVKRVVARCYDSRSMSIYEEMGIQSISALSWATQRIEELLENEDYSTLFSAGNGEVEVYEIEVPASLDGKTVKDISSVEEALVMSVSRTGKAHFPVQDFELKSGDLLHIGATFEGIKAFQSMLQKGQEV
ncbi:MAG TPA: TrkA family potassium uptake protein [Bellilinea sp.]|nr:TrkA family potassium uptake protein [Bellilinea sp.]